MSVDRNEVLQYRPSEAEYIENAEIETKLCYNLGKYRNSSREIEKDFQRVKEEYECEYLGYQEDQFAPKELSFS